MEEKAERLQELKMVSDFKETAPFRHTYELTERWQNTQGLHRFKPDGVPALRRANRSWVPPITRSYLYLIPADKGKTSTCLWWVFSGNIKCISG